MNEINELTITKDPDYEIRTYDLKIDPSLFKEQRKMLIEFQQKLINSMVNSKNIETAELELLTKHEALMEGLINLTDSIADQAADNYKLLDAIITNKNDK